MGRGVEKLELFSLEGLLALLIIIGIDLVLAGDNAVVIGMAARNVPQEKQKKVIFWGTAGAIVIRILATVLVVKLLDLPGLHLAGGLLLIWISYKLLIDNGKKHEIEAKPTVGKAIVTIMVADAAMGIDNVVAVAGAAHGNVWLVILGLLISIPIMIFGSTLVIKLMNRFPVVIYIGAGILAFTAAKMILAEHFLHGFVEALSYGKWGVVALIVAAVLIAGKIRNSRQVKTDFELEA
mgnify:CR=1 FL=1